MFQPALPLGGYAGWRFLQRTLDQQRAAFEKSPQIARDTEYFRENIGKVSSAEALVSDRRLLPVALRAFGLETDISSRAFIRKVLEDGTLKADALGNRLADKRYLAFSKAFGFGDFSTPRTVLSSFPDEILSRFKERSFEAAVGETDNSLRLALNLQSAFGDTVRQGRSTRAQWFNVMGNPALREVLQTALGLPQSFGRIDIDQQVDQFRSRARTAFGTDNPAEMLAPEVLEKVTRLYLVRSEAQAGGTTGSAGVALSILQSIPRPAR